jgi:hypothetical protein
MAADLTLVATTGGKGSPRAADEAWGHVLDGIRSALAVRDLPYADEASLRRCYRLAATCAGRQEIHAIGGDA